MIKKLAACLLSIMFVAYSFVSNPSVVFADDDDDTCALEKEESKDAYKKCLDKKKEDLENQIKEATGKKEEAIKLAQQYGDSINEIQAEIDILVPQIEALEIQIKELEKNIEENEKKVETLKNRILKRMKSAQATMHFNPYLDFILGSNGFADMLRRSYGVEAITSKEEKDRNELIEILNQLNADKEACDKAKQQLDLDKTSLDAKKAEAEIKQAYYNSIRVQVEEEIQVLREESSRIVYYMTSIDYNLDDLLGWEVEDGFIHAVAGASISAGIPAYPDGGMHIGVDYAAGYGTPILSPANGIVLNYADGCTNDHGNHLGDTCPASGDGHTGTGMSSGGNQVRMIFSVNGYIYGLVAFHMLNGTPHHEGAVQAGIPIGQVGSSGNSTGAHCHIELFYLGPGDPEDIASYIDRGYTIGFNLGYNTSSLCYNKGSAPCRLDPRDYFGRSNVLPYEYLR